MSPGLDLLESRLKTVTNAAVALSLAREIGEFTREEHHELELRVFEALMGLAVSTLSIAVLEIQDDKIDAFFADLKSATTDFAAVLKAVQPGGNPHTEH